MGLFCSLDTCNVAQRKLVCPFHAFGVSDFQSQPWYSWLKTPVPGKLFGVEDLIPNQGIGLVCDVKVFLILVISINMTQVRNNLLGHFKTWFLCKTFLGWIYEVMWLAWFFIAACDSKLMPTFPHHRNKRKKTSVQHQEGKR